MRKLTDSPSPTAAFLARHSAIIALALFAIVGVAVLDDYGITYDEGTQRKIGNASFDYILGDEDALLETVDKYYGVAFELPLTAIERLSPLEDSRDIYLMRHLLTHLFFLAGGFFCWLLARRLFGSRLIALLAMLIFLLHPRLYAHSFFNTKDLPFLSMFMIALYLIHRAFRRDSVWAFALCGVGVGLLANIRIMGVMLIPAVLGMLALDALFAARRDGPGAAKGALAGAGAFCAAFAATLYATWPSTWRDPLFVLEALEALSVHPYHFDSLFRGEVIKWPDIPWDFIPTWISITTPPVALALAALGIGCVARLCAADWRGALANSTARFGLLALGCLILPVAVVIALNSNMFYDWRHMYFLYAPMCVLAAFGLRGLAALPKPRFRAAAFGAAALGIAAAAAQMVILHPLQSEYFNPLADKGGLAERWHMNYWRVSHKEAFDALLKIQPSGRIAAAHETAPSVAIIPPDDRRRIAKSPSFPSFRIIDGDGGDLGYRVIWKREVYGVPIAMILDSGAEAEAAFQAAYAAERESEPAASAGGFDMYRYAGGVGLAYINEDCGEDDASGRIELSIFPVDPSDLPQTARDAGLEYESRDFNFHIYGARFDGKCVVIPNIPEYPISHIETGQWLPGESSLWDARILYGGHGERYERALSSLSGEPAARSGFDLWLNDGTLTYVKENCDEEDTRGRFFLSVFPADPSDLSQDARDAGREHESLNFAFDRYGATVGGGCVIVRRLPGYAISRVETGQWIPGEGELWSAETTVGD